MIRSDRFWAGRLLNCLCILFFLLTVTCGRRYDKCLTRDGRQGVCVVMRYCREASQHELLPCERDEEHHCCPIPTTQRSAPAPPAPHPHEDDRYRPAPETKEKRPEVFREPERDDRLNKTPPPADRRNPPRYDDRPKKRPYTDRPDVYESDRRRTNEPQGNNKQLITARPDDYERDRRRPYDPQGDRKQPSTIRPDDYESDRRPYDTQGDRKRPVNTRPDDDERDRRRPYEPEVDRKQTVTRGPDDYDNDRRRMYEPQGNPKRPVTSKPDQYENDRRRPQEPKGNPNIHSERPRDDSPSRSDRPSSRPVDYDRRDRPGRHPDDDRYRPTKDDSEYSRVTDPPRRVNHDRSPDPPRRVNHDRTPDPPRRVNHDKAPDPPRRVNHEKIPDRKNRTVEDVSKAPIRFPEPYEFSVPRPKVPACGVKPYELFIAGGQESAEHEWPWMTAIFRRFPDSRPKTFLCGGSLINTKYVLTAAHCFVNNYVILPASSFVVRLGSHFLDSGEEYTVANLVIHHNHSGSDFFNDIALVRLASEVYITDKIAPICLPYPEMIQDNLVDRLATVAGWGDTAFRTSGTRILQHVTVPIVSGEECFAAYSRVRGAAFLARGSDHVICAGLREGGKDACLGDSGGPLMLKMPDDRWVIIGIVSLGYKCAEPGYPGVYTRVTHYMTWINTNMKKY